MDKSVYAIWLSLAVGFDNNATSKLYTEFETSEAIYNHEDFGKKYGKYSDQLNKKSLDKALEIYNICRSKNVGILPYDADEYPHKLRKITSPPPVLYYKGRLDKLSEMCTVAIVGTRKMTEYGKLSSYKFAKTFAMCDVNVASGMAAGIDTMAHRGALDGDGYTIAVLGTPIDRIYPVENTALYHELVEKGLVLSEYYPTATTSRFCFPQRNRIISGISDATFVVEASEGSGALITAALAVKQGRKVFALPGNVIHEGSLGTNELIKKGAVMTLEPKDVLTEMQLLYPSKIKPFHNITIEPQKKPQKKKKIPDVLDKTEKAVYDIICQKGFVSTDTIGKMLNLDAGDTMSAVSVLEIYKLVKPVAGGLYTVTAEP